MENTNTRIRCPAGAYELTASFIDGCVVIQAYSDANCKHFMLEFTDSTLPKALAGYKSASSVYALMVDTYSKGFNLTDDGQLTLNLTVVDNSPVFHTITLVELVFELEKDIPKLN